MIYYLKHFTPVLLCVQLPQDWLDTPSRSNNIERIIGYKANSESYFHLQLPLYLVVARTSSLATTHDASLNDLSAISMMTAVMVQMNMQIAPDQLAVLPSLPATTNAVF